MNKRKFKLKNRRGVSDIIVTLLLIGIAVTGGIFVTQLFTFSFFDEFTNEQSGEDGFIEPKGRESLKLVGFDTRDGTGLAGITGLDNTPNGLLCTKTCKDLGTDFIVLKFRNASPTIIQIESININEVKHTHDSTTAGIVLGTSFPDEGSFSVIPPTGTTALTQVSERLLNSGEEIRVVIRLSGDIPADIKLAKAIRIFVSTSVNEDIEFIIPSGSSE